jgi:hypothetical protein
LEPLYETTDAIQEPEDKLPVVIGVAAGWNQKDKEKAPNE